MHVLARPERLADGDVFAQLPGADWRYLTARRLPPAALDAEAARIAGRLGERPGFPCYHAAKCGALAANYELLYREFADLARRYLELDAARTGE